MATTYAHVRQTVFVYQRMQEELKLTSRQRGTRQSVLVGASGEGALNGRVDIARPVPNVVPHARKDGLDKARLQ